MSQREIVTISRHWGNPVIKVRVNHEAIGLQIRIDDYLVALVAEIGNPAMMLTQAQLLARLRGAAERVRMKVQESSVAI